MELPPAQQRRYLFQSVSEALARVARSRPQLLVLEGLHWADESTLALLIYLANRIAELPAVIVGTYRGGYANDNPALVRTLEELIRMGVRPQKLGGLSKDAVAQMLHELSRRQATGGLLGAPSLLADLAIAEVLIAMQQAETYPQRLEQAEIHRLHAMMLIDRGAPGDREKAQTLLREALKSYTQIGMSRHIEMTRALLN